MLTKIFIKNATFAVCCFMKFNLTSATNRQTLKIIINCVDWGALGGGFNNH